MERVEFKFQFPSGTWELRIDGTNDGGDANYNWDISTIPDRFTHRWQGFGPPGIVMDDYVIWECAGVGIPSDATKHLVIEMLRLRAVRGPAKAC